ncbi:hypothetical protein [Micromonospora aurantiaca (nom. illeg.)]|uniref:hypothetical protein n=1 Tax=Micromonospora aurantiaca (nom. illeg.) TaxID=47850 RepID=UPI003F4A737B
MTRGDNLKALAASADEFRRACADMARAGLRLDATPPVRPSPAAWADLRAARAAIDRALSCAPVAAGDRPEGGTP